jgi:hypothetical protein
LFSAVEYLGRKGYDCLTGSKTADNFVGCWMDHDPRLMGGAAPGEGNGDGGGACAGGAAMAAAGCGAQKTKVPFVGKTVGTGHSEATVSVRRKDVTKY